MSTCGTKSVLCLLASQVLVSDLFRQIPTWNSLRLCHLYPELTSILAVGSFLSLFFNPPSPYCSAQATAISCTACCPFRWILCRKDARLHRNCNNPKQLGVGVLSRRNDHNISETPPQHFCAISQGGKNPHIQEPNCKEEIEPPPLPQKTKGCKIRILSQSTPYWLAPMLDSEVQALTKIASIVMIPRRVKDEDKYVYRFQQHSWYFW